ncbi:hypothetical protein AAK979_04050 [Ileibacterium valens]|uniref:hypothetical protein n=2 Tax=Ileibacterium valens TaxID=1862668 RepID=UPI003518A516
MLLYNHEQKLKNYLDDSENWNSFAFFKTKLLEMIYEYFADLSFEIHLPFLLEHQELYDKNELSFLYDLLGLSKLRKYDESAIEILQNAKSLAVILNIPGWLELIDYHLIISYLRFMQPAKALMLFDECGHDFQEAGAHRRILDLRFSQARCLGM